MSNIIIKTWYQFDDDNDCVEHDIAEFEYTTGKLLEAAEAYAVEVNRAGPSWFHRYFKFLEHCVSYSDSSMVNHKTGRAYTEYIEIIAPDLNQKQQLVFEKLIKRALKRKEIYCEKPRRK